MNILSVHYGHDSSCCILKDSQIVAYHKEERISKIKRDVNPLESLFSCIVDFYQKYESDIDKVVFTSTDSNPPTTTTLSKLIHHLTRKKEYTYLHNFHHCSHASLAYCNSEFDDCLVVVVDGRGSKVHEYKNFYECESVYYASESSLVPLVKNIASFSYMGNVEENILPEDFEDIKKTLNCDQVNFHGPFGGITSIYNTAPLLYGQTPDDNGKAMGLSSYGEKIENFGNLFNPDGKVNSDLFEIFEYEIYKSNYGIFSIPIHKNYKDKITNEVTPDNYKLYADYCYEIQTQTQEEVGNLIERTLNIVKRPISNICIVGGYGMNIVANHYLLQRFPNLNFYFEPLSDDSGASIGAAHYANYKFTGEFIKSSIGLTFFNGRNYQLPTEGGKKTTVEEVAQMLFENKSVAVYKGLSESGQRALGHRSIFFNVLNPDAKDIVNHIKKREWYRPFAAVVLEEDAKEYFEMGKIESSPHMTIAFKVKDEYAKLFLGITHIDKTCRIQTVSKENEYLYDLLLEFKKISGYGILLNTSFNLAGSPLVETPDDAFCTLNKSTLDYLWFEENQLIYEKEKVI